MPRGGGGRSSGGGGRRSYRSYSAAPRASAPPPAPPKAAAAAPAPAPATGSLGSGGGVLSTIADGYLWSTGWAMAQRSMDRIFGPRKLEVEHTATPAAAAAASSSPCDIHTQVFLDCINHNASDISRCQHYVDLLNDCRRRGQQVAVVEA